MRFQDHPWAFDKRNVGFHMAAVKLYSSLSLFRHRVARTSSSSDASVFVPFLSYRHPKEHVYSILDEKTKQWHGSEVLMEWLSHTCLVSTPMSGMSHVTSTSGLKNSRTTPLMVSRRN
eukprot:TRINITY_DN63423_c0_g1_i1.p1 TRINITY_DN63423_c0_g1~~TRINITY_DN63423_c0_g1_i1.p1  ORF type:complete len:118 (-),score=3.58 TRINITY_DN63423_c0_g1_i1:370-723(-)